VSHCYFDYYQADPEFQPPAGGGLTTLKEVYSFSPVPSDLSVDESKLILGGQGNLWTEYIPTPSHAEYMALPRMTALAEVLWSPSGSRDWDDFRARLQTQFAR
jgi:hexosaminidase